MDRHSLAYLLLVYLAASHPAAAKPRSLPSTKAKPIEMKMGLSPMGSSLGYYLDGKDINHFKDLKDLMGSCGDPEAMRLIRGAEDADKWGWGFLLSGLTLGIVTAITVPPSPLLHIELIDRAATGGFYAQFLVLPGALFQVNASAQKFDAVQRYNRIIRGEEPTVLKVTPQLYANKDVLGLGLNCRF